ncbi:MAG TPA: helix-turn-helix domain-containing protein [Egibacteraceae bacterium]|nr:helix-turn-helix domain-containing protein [Egibacteraceae bacterium]
MATNERVVSRPGPRVRPFVERYVGYRMAGYEPAMHRGLPSRYMTFIVSIDHPIDVVRQTSEAQAPRTYRSVLGGLQASPALISHDGNQEGVAIELTPLGSRSLFGMPARAVWNLTLELHEVAGPIGDELWERLQDAPGWRERFAACDAVLARLAGENETAVELVGCWRALVSSHGQLPIDILAREVSYSRQHLARRFREEFGLGPKLAARIIRFERANRMMRATRSYVSLAEVAAMCGYADQSHLTRDFTALAGCSPAQWLRDEELPILQDEDPSGVRA